MAEETVTQQIVREAPEIEAYKLKLLQEAQKLAFNQSGGQTLAQQLPGYQVAGFSPGQTAAITAAERQGIGAFTPYMTAANQALGGAYNTTAEAGPGFCALPPAYRSMGGGQRTCTSISSALALP